MIDEEIDGISYIGSDNYSVGRMAAETQYRQAMNQAEKLLRERPNTRGIFEIRSCW